MFLAWSSQMADYRLLIDGVAFVVVGLVGIWESWTTIGTGSNIKAVLETGDDRMTSGDNPDASREILEAGGENLAVSKEILMMRK